MNIQEMVKQTEAGYLHNNRYSVILNTPNILNKSIWTNEKIELISKNTSAISVPGSEILTAEWQNKGPTYKIPYKRNFNDITIVSYNDGKNYARAFWEDWKSNMYDINSYNWAYINDITASIIINSKNKQNEIVATYTLFNAYPITIEDMQLDTTDGEIQTVSVTLTYTNYIMESQQ